SSIVKKQMSDKIFFDTNVLVYCYTETEPMKKTIAQALAQSPDAWASTQVLQELSNTLHKKFGKTWAEIDLTVEEVCQNFAVFINQPETVRGAIRTAERYKYSFYDSLILSSCLAIGCKTVYSEDMKNGQVIDGTLEIKNPFLP
ncbi:MAG TPA: PIN domain-containing protein, partial [Saprospiraceae bacterium]|nr:PIN domain-containing protein [Saprospiraceae bacterium]